MEPSKPLVIITNNDIYAAETSPWMDYFIRPPHKGAEELVAVWGLWVNFQKMIGWEEYGAG